MTSYKEKLKHPKWQKTRLKIFERDNWRCQMCKSQDNILHVHHRNYFSCYKNPWDYPDYLLVTLCELCHKEETEFRQKSEDFLIELLRRKLFHNQVYNLGLCFNNAKDDTELINLILEHVLNYIVE